MKQPSSPLRRFVLLGLLASLLTGTLITGIFGPQFGAIAMLVGALAVIGYAMLLSIRELQHKQEPPQVLYPHQEERRHYHD